MGDPLPPQNQAASTSIAAAIPKTATQIEGLDEILKGGLPIGRVTLVGGGPGAGKTVFGLELLYRAALSGEPGIFLSFEESAANIRQNARSFGWDLAALEKSGKLFLMEGLLDPEVVISGNFNLAGFLSIIEGKARDMGAGRVVIDALDVLMRYFDDPMREQQQFLGLHNWLVDNGLTAVLTTKNTKGTERPSPYEYLDFMADCVIYLDQKAQDQVNTKRMQIVKYRGSAYGSNEYPFLVTDKGMYFHAISDMLLDFEPSSKRASSGVPQLDEILGGGYFQGSAILISGMTGTGKTSVAATFAHAACAKGQKVLYINFEESRPGLLAGMRSIGIDLGSAIEGGSLWVMSTMPESRGIEEHLYDKVCAIKRFKPDHVVVDAISACKRIAGDKASFDFIMRLVNFCRRRGITTVLINQSSSEEVTHAVSGIGISSIIDTILTLYYEDAGAQTNRLLQVLKSRGTHHSNRYHTFVLTDDGVQFRANRPDQ